MWHRSFVGCLPKTDQVWILYLSSRYLRVSRVSSSNLAARTWFPPVISSACRIRSLLSSARMTSSAGSRKASDPARSALRAFDDVARKGAPRPRKSRCSASCVSPYSSRAIRQDGRGVTLRDPLHHFEDPLEGGGLGHDLVDVATVPLDTLEHRHFFSLTVSNVSAIRS